MSDSRDQRLETAGQVIANMNVRLFDAEDRDVTATGKGRPACKGPLQSRGYWADPEADVGLFREDGWMRVDDEVEIDGDGYLRVIGRADDFIIRGGKNISAVAVEQEVGMHPAVGLAAAVAKPDDVFGERVCVYVELVQDAELSLDELLRDLRSREVSKENLPEDLVVLDRLPRNSGGKVAKQALREHARSRAGGVRTA